MRSFEQDIEQRAFAAYFRFTENALQPSRNLSGEETVNGKRYVVLRNTNGILAVYRVKPDGALKGLKRWPAALDADGVVANVGEVIHG
jgi:hypothetical protein